MVLYVSRKYADMAQEAAHFLGKEEVTGSNPVISSNKKALEQNVQGSFFIYKF